MILDIILEAIGKFLEDSFKSKSKTGWIIVGLILVLFLIILLTRCWTNNL